MKQETFQLFSKYNVYSYFYKFLLCWRDRYFFFSNRSFEVQTIIKFQFLPTVNLANCHSGNHIGNDFGTLNENIKSLSQFRSTFSHSGTYLIFGDLDVITLTIYVRINFY